MTQFEQYLLDKNILKHQDLEDLKQACNENLNGLPYDEMCILLIYDCLPIAQVIYLYQCLAQEKKFSAEDWFITNGEINILVRNVINPYLQLYIENSKEA